jgi:hypothetical protein
MLDAETSLRVLFETCMWDSMRKAVMMGRINPTQFNESL